MKLEDFQPELDIIRHHGFNPIGIGFVYQRHETYKAFIFETEPEYKECFKLEERGLIKPASFWSKDDLDNEKWINKPKEIIWLNDQENN